MCVSSLRLCCKDKKVSQTCVYAINDLVKKCARIVTQL